VERTGRFCDEVVLKELQKASILSVTLRDSNQILVACKSKYYWVPVITAWRILRLRKEETASRYGK
jgi:coenzyme F420-reducing hydrogenase beta subunit